MVFFVDKVEKKNIDSDQAKTCYIGFVKFFILNNINSQILF